MKLRNTQILVVFLILLIALLVGRYLKNERSKGNMITSFFSFDSEDVIAFRILPAFNEDQLLQIVKEDNKWHLVLPDGNICDINQEHFERAFSEFEKLRPSRLVTEDEKLFNQYMVDSTGTLLEIVTPDNKKHQIILGDLTFQNDVYVNTYVRLPGDNAVYAAAAYMEGTFKSLTDLWRSREIVSIPQGLWTEVEMTGMQGKKMLLIKEEEEWKTQGKHGFDIPLDEVLRQIDELKELPFAPNYLTPEFKNPEWRIRIKAVEAGEIFLSFYLLNEVIYLGSSINTGNYFIVDESRLQLLFDYLQ